MWKTFQSSWYIVNNFHGILYIRCKDKNRRNIMARYLLMNKNTPVLEFDYDLEVHAVMKILEVHDARYAPPSTVDQKGNVTKKALNAWWKGRAIPASRNQIQQVLDCLDLDSTLALAEKNFGLSLSDRYWINDTAAPQQWKDINFFDNNFTDDLGILTLGQQSSGHPNLMSPNSTLGGDLNKKWKIVNGERILLKTGSALFRQEVQNEVAATVLHQQLLEKEDYVPYFLHQEGRSTYSACKNMLGENEELITAYDVLCNKKKPSSMNDYQFLLSVYQELGLKNAEEMLDNAPEYQLSEPQSFMSAKAYKTKIAEPLIQKLKALVKTALARCFEGWDNYHRLNITNGNLYRENEMLSKINSKLKSENENLRSEVKDYKLLRKVFGHKQIDELLENIKGRKRENTRSR